MTRTGTRKIPGERPGTPTRQRSPVHCAGTRRGKNRDMRPARLLALAAALLLAAACGRGDDDAPASPRKTGAAPGEAAL